MAKIPRRRLAATLAERSLSLSDPQLADEIAGYLIAERRVGELESLLRDMQQYRADHGIVEATAVTAYPLTSVSRADIESRLQRLYPAAKKIIITEQLDLSVVGGVRLELANQRLDLSVRNTLNRFKQLTNFSTAGKA